MITINRITYEFSKERQGCKKMGNSWWRVDNVHLNLEDKYIRKFEEDMKKGQKALSIMCDYISCEPLPMLKGQTENGSEFIGYVFQEFKDSVLLYKYVEEEVTDKKGNKTMEDIMYSARCKKETLQKI